MKTTLNADGNIGIPAAIRETDHLTAGDSFELERLTSATTYLPGSHPLVRASRSPPLKMGCPSSARRTAPSRRGW